MNKIFLTLGKIITLVATWVSHISLRGLVICFGIFLSVFSQHVNVLDKIDRLFLQANSYIFSPPLGSANISIVRVPQKELSIWQEDIHSSGKLAALLSNILNSSEATVALLLQQPVDTGSGAADVLIELSIDQQSKDYNQTHAKALVDRKFILMDLLNNSRVVLGVERFYFSGQKPVLIESPYIGKTPNLMRRLLWPDCSHCLTLSDSVRVARPPIQQFTLLDQNFPFFQAFLSEKNEHTFSSKYSGFLVELLRAKQKIDRDDNLVWRLEHGLTVGNIQLPTSTSGEYIALNNVIDYLQPRINEMPLEEALARNAFPKTVFIASEHDVQVQQFAEALFSIENDQVISSPWWSVLIIGITMLLATFYLGFAITRIKIKTACLVSGIFILSLIVMQISLVVIKSAWVPIALPIIWVLLGHFLLLVWRIKKDRIQTLINRADNICIANARSLMEQKQLDRALAELEGCTSKVPLMQTLYEISEAYTESKNYAKAVEVLRLIQKRSKSYKDSEQKLKVLSTMLKTMDNSTEADNFHKTMVISQEEQEQRIIGRYRIEREIGRGAMGRVYLAFDPRIARRVAIKTMNYDQFNGKVHSDIKSRFFREAEAAGRLSHPSIVSVFDVGEELDLAFIAMDFAEGKALNHFVDSDNLLPVFEVYRIIHDVAVALQYAHENNVVHRDIKPGNIIYNPSPYQVKVTDFGIARLIDDSKTNTGEILGSPLYMAPEQLKGEKVKRSADIFSLGITFYQLLTGKLPYSGENLAALTYEIIHGRHRGVRTVRKDLPASAARITNQALQKDPEDRYETAAEFALVLKKAIKRDFASESKRAGFF